MIFQVEIPLWFACSISEEVKQFFRWNNNIRMKYKYADFQDTLMVSLKYDETYHKSSMCVLSNKAFNSKYDENKS